MSQQFLSQAGSFVIASERQTFLANSVLHLFVFGYTPSPSSTLVEILANECDFDGYAPITIATFGAPALAPGSGWMIFSPAETFRWTHVADDVSNTVGGWFLVDSNGDLADVFVYDAPGKPMQGPGQIVQEIVVEVFPTNPA